MNMPLLPTITQSWIRTVAPMLFSFVTRILYGSYNIKIGSNLHVEGVPRIIIDKGASITIANDVTIRAGVEIRAHGNSTIEIGDNVRIDRGVRILSANESNIKIGAGSRIGLYSVFNGGDSIVLGNNVLVSGFVYLQTSQHRFDTRGVPIRNQGYSHAPIRVGDGAWVAAHAVIMPGVDIGEDAIVGSNSVVTKSVRSSNIVGGVPARVIKDPVKRYD